MQVAERDESNRVSALGFALGYLGGGLLFLCNAELVTASRAGSTWIAPSAHCASP